MISEERPYRLGPLALVAMVFGKLKYPVIFAGVLVLLWFTGFHAVFKYGAFFTIMLAVFLSLAEVPEYLGYTIMLGDRALYVRSGIISHQVVAMEYTKISEVKEKDPEQKNIFGLKDLSIAQHQGEHSRTVVIPLLTKKFRTELEKAIAGHTQSV